MKNETFCTWLPALFPPNDTPTSWQIFDIFSNISYLDHIWQLSSCIVFAKGYTTKIFNIFSNISSSRSHKTINRIASQWNSLTISSIWIRLLSLSLLKPAHLTEWSFSLPLKGVAIFFYTTDLNKLSYHNLQLPSYGQYIHP